MVSLIIPTFNKVSRLKLMLSSLEQQTYTDNFEIVIVNNGSNDGTKKYLEQLNPPFLLKYAETEHTGRASARNAGIDMAKGDILIFVDDDVLLCPDFIEEHVKLQKEPRIVHGRILSLPQLKFFEDPAKGIFYPGLTYNNASKERLKEMCITVDDVTKYFQEKIVLKARMTEFEKVIKKVLTSDDNQSDWIGFTGGNVSLPKFFLEVVGGFDQEFGKKWGCEDIELGFRLHKKGYGFLYGENAANYHMMHYHADFQNEHRIGIDYFYKKHKDNKILQFQDFVESRIKQDEFIQYLLTDCSQP